MLEENSTTGLVSLLPVDGPPAVLAVYHIDEDSLTSTGDKFVATSGDPI